LKELINSDTLAVFGTDNNIMKNTYEIKELKMEQVTVKEMMDKVGKKTFSGVVYDLTTNSMVLQTKRNTFYLNENKLKSWENDKMYVVKFTTGKKKVNYFSRNITKTLARSFKEILDWLKITPLPFFELLKKIGIQPKDLKGLLETLRDNKLVTLKEYHSTITEKGRNFKHNEILTSTSNSKMPFFETQLMQSEQGMDASNNFSNTPIQEKISAKEIEECVYQLTNKQLLEFDRETKGKYPVKVKPCKQNSNIVTLPWSAFKGTGLNVYDRAECYVLLKTKYC